MRHFGLFHEECRASYAKYLCFDRTFVLACLKSTRFVRRDDPSSYRHYRQPVTVSSSNPVMAWVTLPDAFSISRFYGPLVQQMRWGD